MDMEDIGIEISGDRNILIGNTSISNDDGIVINAAGDRNIVVGNFVRFNTTAQITNNGSNTDLGHNIIA